MKNQVARGTEAEVGVRPKTSGRLSKVQILCPLTVLNNVHGRREKRPERTATTHGQWGDVGNSTGALNYRVKRKQNPTGRLIKGRRRTF